MIKVTEIENNVFEVKQNTLCFREDYSTSFYWDMNRKLISMDKSFPENMETKTLTDGQLDRFENHYRSLIV